MRGCTLLHAPHRWTDVGHGVLQVAAVCFCHLVQTSRDAHTASFDTRRIPQRDPVDMPTCAPVTRALRGRSAWVPTTGN